MWILSHVGLVGNELVDKQLNIRLYLVYLPYFESLLDNGSKLILFRDSTNLAIQNM
jgi:hypothetical protein